MKMKDLKAAPYNPRVMNERARKGLNASLKEFGDLSGITFNKSTGNLVTGHHRVDELKSIHGEENLEIDDKGGYGHILCPNGDAFPLRIVEWSLEKEQAANITANNQNIQGKFTNNLQPMLWKLKDEMSDKFAKLKMDALVKHGKTKIEEVEEEFSVILNEANNYVVLVFNNTVDWLTAVTHFELKTVSTRKRAAGKAWSKGIGRVIDGASYLTKITGGNK